MVGVMNHFANGFADELEKLASAVEPFYRRITPALAAMSAPAGGLAGGLIGAATGGIRGEAGSKVETAKADAVKGALIGAGIAGILGSTLGLGINSIHTPSMATSDLFVPSGLSGALVGAGVGAGLSSDDQKTTVAKGALAGALAGAALPTSLALLLSKIYG